jgi:prolyl oligopeptidase
MAGKFAHYVMNSSGHWSQLTRFEDGFVSVKVSADDALYLLSRKGAPRGQILRLPLTHLDLSQAKVIIPQSSGSGPDESARASIDNFLPTTVHLYVNSHLQRS